MEKILSKHVDKRHKSLSEKSVNTPDPPIHTSKLGCVKFLLVGRLSGKARYAARPCLCRLRSIRHGFFGGVSPERRRCLSTVCLYFCDIPIRCGRVKEAGRGGRLCAQCVKTLYCFFICTNLFVRISTLEF